MSELYLIADTNLFFECKNLEELDWGLFGVARIVIVVCKPVQEEIDKHKNASKRTKRTAVKYGGIFRAMLKSGSLEKPIEHADVDIALRLDPSTQPSPNSGQLDYSSNDDRIVGITKSYFEKYSGSVKLLTHDTGPSATAHSLDVPYQFIPDDWLRPTDENPELNNALQEIEAYKRQEPAFEINIEKLNEAGKLVFDVPECEPLTPAEIDGLVLALKRTSPMVTDFRDAPSSALPSVVKSIAEYQSPSDADIQEYQKVKYLDWIEQCKRVFERTPEAMLALESQLFLSVKITNTGSRPAEMSKVRFEAQGHLRVRRPQNEDVTDQEGLHFDLPQPPAAPEGRWITSIERTMQEGLLRAGQGKDFSKLVLVGSKPGFLNPLDSQTNLAVAARPQHRDAETFYWRGSPDESSALLELECQNWRHNSKAEEFLIGIQPTEGGTSGVINCSVVANNLTHNFSINIPISFEKRTLSAFEKCNSLIEKLNRTLPMF